MEFQCSLICIFLLSKGIKQIFQVPSVLYLLRHVHSFCCCCCLFLFAVYFLDWLKYSRYSPHVTSNCGRLFSHSPGWSLSFAVQSSLHFMKSFPLTLGITSWVTGNRFRKSFRSCLGIPSHPVTFFSSFKHYINVFVFTFVQGERSGSSVLLLHMDI